MEISINPSLAGGAVTVAFFAGIIWLAFKAIKMAIFWAALGGIPLFKLSSNAFEMLLNGHELSEIIKRLSIDVIFFLKPLDELFTYTSSLYVVIPVFILMMIWLVLCIRFAMYNLATRMLHADSLWGIPLGVSLWYVLSGTAEGLRSYLSSAFPFMETLLMSYYGLSLILLSIIIVIPLGYLKYRHTSLEM